MARRRKAEMEELKKQALHLIGTNPRLSISRVAKHYGVSEPTVSKWFDEAGLKRWH